VSLADRTSPSEAAAISKSSGLSVVKWAKLTVYIVSVVENPDTADQFAPLSEETYNPFDVPAAI
jgi:hypothetical protein